MKKRASKNLKIALQSEIYGEALFFYAKKMCLNKDRKYKLAQLLALEIKTKQKIVAFYQKEGIKVPAYRSHALKGKLQGLAIPWLWKTAMQQTLKETEHFLSSFTKLKAESNSKDAELFQFIIDHEKAIQSFAREELAGNTDASIDDVNALL